MAAAEAFVAAATRFLDVDVVFFTIFFNEDEDEEEEEEEGLLLLRQSLHLERMRLWWQMDPPPQSLHTERIRLCLQMEPPPQSVQNQNSERRSKCSCQL